MAAALCDGKLGQDGELRPTCPGCWRYRAPRGGGEVFLEPMTRRVAGTSKWVCEMRIESPLPAASSSRPRDFAPRSEHPSGALSFGNNKKRRHVSTPDGPRD